MTFTDIHKCEVVRNCEQQAVVWALFRGSLSLTCGEHITMVDEHYDTDFYTHSGDRFEI